MDLNEDLCGSLKAYRFSKIDDILRLCFGFCCAGIWQSATGPVSRCQCVGDKGGISGRTQT